jgi:hypothetical protein
VLPGAKKSKLKFAKEIKFRKFDSSKGQEAERVGNRAKVCNPKSKVLNSAFRMISFLKVVPKMSRPEIRIIIGPIINFHWLGHEEHFNPSR